MRALVAAAVEMNPGVAGTESTVTRVILGTDCAHPGPERPRTSWWLVSKGWNGTGQGSCLASGHCPEQAP